MSPTQRARESVEPDADRIGLRVEGMDCAEETALLRRVLKPLVEDESQLAFDVVGGTLWVEAHAGEPSERAVVQAVATTGMRATPISRGADATRSVLDARQRRRAILTLAAGAAMVAGVVVDAVQGDGLLAALGLRHDGHVVGWAARSLYAVTIAIAYRYVLPRAWGALRRLRPDMNLLMTVAVVGALVIGEWLEGAAVSFLFALSLTIEGWSAGRARHAIDAILRLTPDLVRVVDENGVEESAVPDRVPVGARFVVRPGERIPLDGTVLEGTSRVDEAPITGESLPVAKSVSSEVFAGTINGDGALTVESTHKAGDTVLARVVRLIAEARTQRAPVERWVDRFAAVYTPAVLALAIAIAVGPPLAAGAAWDTWIYRALVLLVVSCPCALVISTPVTLVSALAASARNGVLVKGASHLETLARVRGVALDKTGTISEGRPRVAEVVAVSGTEEDVLALSAGVEARSEHPLARAIVLAAEQRGLAVSPATDFVAIPGKGARGSVRLEDGRTRSLWIGSHPFVEELDLETPELHEELERLAQGGRSVVILGTDRGVLGMIALADGLRPESTAAIESLRTIGVEHISLLTGDNRETAEVVGAQCGIRDIRAELLPHDKVTAIERLLDDVGEIAMVGDGVNDAPALARASVGIAMGAAGSDAAIETADVALMADDLRKLPWLIQHARAAMRTVRMNVALSLAVKGAFVLLAAVGYASLWTAIAADMGASLLVTLNGLSLLRRRSGLTKLAHHATENSVPRLESGDSVIQ